MKYTKFLPLIVAVFCHNQSLFADTVITFFLEPYPATLKPCKPSKGKPAMPQRLCLSRALDPNIVNGIIATYGGYVNVSDELGQISFPFKQVTPAIKLLITPEITPVLMGGNTVHHWTLDKNTPTAMYAIEKKQDEVTQLYYWDTQSIELPTNRAIPKETVILLAQPNDIYVATGITPSTDNPHLILPAIYVKKEIDAVEHSLFMLNLIHLFGPVDNVYDKKEALRYTSQLAS